MGSNLDKAISDRADGHDCKSHHCLSLTLPLKVSTVSLKRGLPLEANNISKVRINI